MSGARGEGALSVLPLLLSHGALNEGLLAELAQLMRSDSTAQWCADSFMPYSASPRVDPVVWIASAPQVVRGGAYQNGTPTLPTQRGALEGHKRHASIGFRLAQSCL